MKKGILREVFPLTNVNSSRYGSLLDCMNIFKSRNPIHCGIHSINITRFVEILYFISK